MMQLDKIRQFFRRAVAREVKMKKKPKWRRNR
jgi:preprotein translocase subunit Sss1